MAKKTKQRKTVLKRLAEAKIIGNEESFPGQTDADKMKSYYKGRIFTALALDEVGARYLGLMQAEKELETHLEEVDRIINKKCKLKNWLIGSGIATGGGGFVAATILFPPILPITLFLGGVGVGAASIAADETSYERRGKIEAIFKKERYMLENLANEIRLEMRQIRNSVSDEELMQSARRDILRQMPDFEKRLNDAFKKALKDGKNEPGPSGAKGNSPAL